MSDTISLSDYSNKKMAKKIEQTRKNKNKNYAFIDSQNLNLSVARLGWKLDFYRFRVCLKEKYGVEVACLFIGYLPEN